MPTDPSPSVPWVSPLTTTEAAMATPATQDPTLSELDARARTAWGTYRENLVDLAGTTYDECEKAEWEHLQTELREIAVERAGARAPAPGAA